MRLSCDPEGRETYYRRNPCLIAKVYRYASSGTHEVISEGSVRLDCIDAAIALDDIYMDAERID
ncbi:MAG TPA: hypothetical protein PLN31_12355 [Azoarcus taiwanensis]|nr:hypothetical protein [Azoarcus taiwanensis]